MLKKFKVKGFTSFEDELVFDLSSPNAYAFLPDCVKDGVVRAAVIHGKNGVGKSNLGLAIFDIFEHLTDFKVEENLYRTYLNANLHEGNEMAEFEYTFGFENQNVIYSYGKTSLHNFIYERLTINGNEMRLCRNKGLRRSLRFLNFEVRIFFRQPNFEDFSKIFDSQAQKYELQV